MRFGAKPVESQKPLARRAVRIMPTVRILSLLSLLLLYGAASSGQGRPTVVERGPAPIFTSGVDMVTINVSVRDGRGRVVRGLDASHFRLVDSGFGRPIDSVFPSDAALRVAVLVDVSGSMAIDHNIDRAWRAVDAVVDALQTVATRLRSSPSTPCCGRWCRSPPS